MNSKCKDLEKKLDQASREKDELYKKQMQQIQENLSVLKEEIQSTNKSIIDQSIGAIPLAETSQLGRLNRMQSPDIFSQGGGFRRGGNEPIS